MLKTGKILLLSTKVLEIANAISVNDLVVPTGATRVKRSVGDVPQAEDKVENQGERQSCSLKTLYL